MLSTISLADSVAYCLKTMLALKKDKKDEESHSGAYFASSCDRTTVLQEARQFNETPINARKCCTTLTKLLYLISQGEQLSRKEATDAFFSITKLWQSNDVVLRRLVYLTIKELASLADDVIIVTSSLTKDMTGKEDIYRASAIRALCKVTDSTMLQAIERYMKQAIVDRIPAVASAALVSTLYLMKKNPDCIRRWTSEIQEAANSDNPMIQFHGLAVYYEMRKNDRLSVVQLVQKYSKQSLKLIEEDEKGRDTGTLLDFLESCLRHKSEMVVYEAASALLRLPNITSKELSSAISVLQMFCSSSKAALRFAAVRTLSSVAGIYPAAVAACNVDLEQLISDQNRSIATLAITTLLKTGAESSVDRLMKQISSFVSEISDEFKVVVIDAVRSLCVRYPKKSTILLSFLSNMLRDEGGFLYKKAIIDTIVWIIEENDEAKEPGLVYLCEFIEDCEHVTLATKVLNLLGKEGPKCSNPRKYIRFIFNRVLLEPPPVRAVAVTAMAKFGVCQSLRADVVTLLQRCLLDSDDEVRDRATFYSVLFSTNNLKLYEELITGGLDVSPSLLVCALREYCAFSSSKFEPFNLNSVPQSQLPIGGQHKPSMDVDVVPTSVKPEKGLKSREEIYEEQLHQIEQFAKFGPLFKSSAPLELTESEVEIAVSCVQHMFLEHIVFQFECSNTLNDQILSNVVVHMKPVSKPWKQVAEIPCEIIRNNDCGLTYVAFQLPSDADLPPAMFSCVMNCTIKDNEDDITDYADEYPLEDVELGFSMQVKPMKMNFNTIWEDLDGNVEVACTYSLPGYNSIQDAIDKILDCVGMAPCERSEKASKNKSAHVLLMAGMFRTGSMIAAQAKLALAPSGVINANLKVRSEDKLAVSFKRLIISHLSIYCVQHSCELELAFLKTMFSSVFLCFISMLVCLFPFGDAGDKCVSGHGKLICKQNPRAVDSTEIRLWDKDGSTVLGMFDPDDLMGIGVPDDDGRFVIEGCASDRDWLPFWKNDPDPYLEIRHTCRLSYGETFHIEGPLIKFLPDNTDFGVIDLDMPN
ncbi:Coatomer subunit gamma-2 [Trichinella pseudospiralis]|uniref:Coatomer subunit gamma n=1 Tax=Trichinella pseudospiralis TaxID=6337 RepID=A0A0V1K0H7_TRIPS|nr:Coatomer subunit gamma-2 [Trichinella pseudospiralis]KRZ40730.1 Coatomer subunit gamma-2 [Trichinella pseudospiralis]